MGRIDTCTGTLVMAPYLSVTRISKLSFNPGLEAAARRPAADGVYVHAPVLETDTVPYAVRVGPENVNVSPSGSEAVTDPLMAPLLAGAPMVGSPASGAASLGAIAVVTVTVLIAPCPSSTVTVNLSVSVAVVARARSRAASVGV